MEEKKNYVEGDWIYDEETYPNFFSLSIIRAKDDFMRQFEISTRKNDFEGLIKCLDYIRDNEHRMVGFNNLGFDYPILHEIYESYLKAKRKKQAFSITAEEIYELAQKQIDSFKGEFGHTIKPQDVILKQVDLYKIHHFDNRAKSTGLKMLEFNMLSNNIEDLPFPVGTVLTEEQMDIVMKYNAHDIKETKKFYQKSIPAIELRILLSEKYGRDFTNHNDTKIGKDYFIMRLEESIPGSCYTFDKKGKRHLNQTKRSKIAIKDCLFDYYNFKEPAFIAVLDWFSKQTIKETKGVFSDILESELGDVAQYAELEEKRLKFKGVPSEQEKALFKINFPLGWIEEVELKGMETVVDAEGNKTKVNKKSYWKVWRQAKTLNVVVNGFRFDFGTGGIHGSITDKIAKENQAYFIEDADVASMYPNIGITNKVYPLHLTSKFCDIYQDVYEQRKAYKKGTPENAVLKLALNGVYGDSNNQYSPFFDPQYTMAITINGQLSLCLLADQLMQIEDLKLIQVNTDGVTVACRHEKRAEYDHVCAMWQKRVGLELEFAQYSKMAIRDVNNYIALYKDGKVKYKGAYVWKRSELGWHQNHSSLIIPMAACAAMLEGANIEEFIRKHAEDPNNKWDFCLRTKVPRSSKLFLRYEDGRNEQQQNICRYYPSVGGGKLIKVMPPLAGKEEAGDRELSIDKEWNVKICNDIDNFDFADVNFDYYIKEAEKLLIGVGNTQPLERNSDDT